MQASTIETGEKTVPRQTGMERLPEEPVPTWFAFARFHCLK